MKNSGLLLIKSLLVIFVSLFLNGCLRDNTDTEINQNEGIESLVIPEDFNFTTVKNVEVELTAPLHLAGSIFEIYRKHSAEDTIGVCRGVFDRNAHYSMIVNLPTYVDTIQVISKYIGLEERVVIPIVGEKAVYDYNYQRLFTKNGVEL